MTSYWVVVSYWFFGVGWCVCDLVCWKGELCTNVATHFAEILVVDRGSPPDFFMKKIHFFGAFAGPEILQAGLFCVNRCILPRQSDSESHKKFTKRGTHSKFWKVLVHNWWPFGIILRQKRSGND